jgi:A/G-specific adenine glycosylase
LAQLADWADLSVMESKRQFNCALGGWFAHYGRGFPWRRTRNPYRVLVAEVLLRKTRAADVVDVYREVVQTWPTVTHLAHCRLGALRRIIAPIGLPGRARAMRQAARLACSQHGGRIPNTRSDLARLPGVGDYIAAAVLCFARGAAVPLVDGGIGRVLGRAFSVPPSGRPAYLDDRLWALADVLLPASGARNHNLALLDLAALVCRRVQPSCDSCPVRNICMARGGIGYLGTTAGTGKR